ALVDCRSFAQSGAMLKDGQQKLLAHKISSDLIVPMNIYVLCLIVRMDYGASRSPCPVSLADHAHSSQRMAWGRAHQPIGSLPGRCNKPVVETSQSTPTIELNNKYAARFLG